ncbi:MAG: carbamoyl-phosphate synthase large subunit [Chthoniobacter sp.]|jgi:carbamoyl-phosphate synthase large subunit|nr:carbamoyl-phosphate synthase large subunit [Chthoniobacter sp.]
MSSDPNPAPAGETITALVTGVGDTVGQALIKALRQSAVPCRVVGTDRDELSVGFQWVDQSFLLPHCSHADEYVRELAAICAAERVRLIFPGSESELELLARHAEALRSDTGAIVVASPPEALRVGLNKWETCRFLKRAGLNYPGFARLDAADQLEQLVGEVGFPLIAKPCRGTGARGLSLVKSWNELEALRGVDREMIMQEYLQPDHEEYSVEVYTRKNGEQVGAISYQRRQLIAGDTYRAKVALHAAVEAEARAVVAALGASGPCNVQLRLTDRGPVTFEINPRFSGGVSMRAHFGYNEPEMALRDLVLDQPVPEPQLRQGMVLRFWEELYLEGDRLDRGKEGTPAFANACLAH